MPGSPDCTPLPASAEEVRSVDWAQTSFGVPETWPISLRHVVDLISKCQVSMLVLWGHDGRVICNDAFSKLSGVPSADVAGRSALAGALDQWQFRKDALDSVLQSGAVPTRDWHVRVERDGKPEDLWVSIDCSPILGEDGRPAGVLAVVHETTRQVQAESALTESDARFRLLADNISQLAWITDATGYVVWYNKRWFDYTGTTLEDMKGWGWRSVHHPDHVDRVVEKVSHCFETGEDWEDTFPLMGHDGSYRWFLSRAHPIRDNGGKVIRWFGTNTDITEHREEAERNAQLAAIVATSPDAIISLSSGGLILSWNPGAERIFGYLAEEVIGKSERMLFAEGADKEFEEKYAQLRKGQSLLRDTVRRRKDGSLVDVAMNAAPMRDSYGKIIGFSAVLRDITEQKRAENHLRVVLRELSHRTKNLLAVIIAMVRQTARRTDDVGTLQSQIVQRLQGMSASHDLLVAEDWAGAPLRDLVKALLAPFMGDAATAISYDGPDVFVTTTAAQNLGLALHELATNAAKYGALSVPTGRVDVHWSLESDGSGGRRLHILWQETGGPKVVPPDVKGFGHVVIERVIAQALNAAVSYEFKETGIVWAISIPPEFIVWQRTHA